MSPKYWHSLLVPIKIYKCLPPAPCLGSYRGKLRAAMVSQAQILCIQLSDVGERSCAAEVSNSQSLASQASAWPGYSLLCKRGTVPVARWRCLRCLCWSVMQVVSGSHSLELERDILEDHEARDLLLMAAFLKHLVSVCDKMWEIFI